MSTENEIIQKAINKIDTVPSKEQCFSTGRSQRIYE